MTMSRQTSPEDGGALSAEPVPAPPPDEDGSGTEGGEPPDERTRIVRLVASGKLSVDQAVELLGTLDSEPRAEGGHGGAYGAPGEPAGRDRGGPFGAAAAPAPTWAMPRPPQPPPPRLPPSLIGRALQFEVQDDDKRVTASLPLGLVGSEGRFLPRLVRQALEESDVDLDQIRDLILNGGADLDEDCTLLEISDGEDKRLTINLR